MKSPIFIATLLVMLAGCSNSDRKGNQSFAVSTGIDKKKVIETARDYLISKMKDPKVGENNGIVRIQGLGEVCILETSHIVIGKLDADDREDAVVTCTYEQTGKPITKKHIVVLNRDSLVAVDDLVSRMEVLTIADQTLFAEISTVPEDDPGPPCSICKDALLYRMQGDSLVKID